MCDQICKLAKKGLTPSQIGVILRDSHGIAQVKSVTGNKVLRILKTNGGSTDCTDCRVCVACTGPRRRRGAARVLRYTV